MAADGDRPVIEHLDGLLAAVVMVVVHRRYAKRQAERLYMRQVTMDKQHKVLRRDVARNSQLANETLEKARAHHQSAKDLNRRVIRTLDERNG